MISLIHFILLLAVLLALNEAFRLSKWFALILAVNIWEAVTRDFELGVLQGGTGTTGTVWPVFSLS